ncbi:NAD(P)H-dependent flavin oxidoreductase [Pseudonocardia hispaniensis]|uniref:NAD(P)H-dependent flavin oxidoreductase n=1 Tax=Pseudonocardia hispaniensis TaxID=904933 RepID=A0ABW1J5E8_9PSEU
MSEVRGPLRTALTRRLAIRHPVVLAPMGGVAGGALAAAVSAGGGLGQIGIGYGDHAWLTREFDRAGGTRVGCGFITWMLAERPELLEAALERRPAAVTLAFGDPGPFAARIRAAGVPLICQVASAGEARRALEVGADVLAAQGSEGGGHAARGRSTMTLVPELVDLVAGLGADVPVLAAGGIGDGRGLAAALVLGADGALIGTRFWACGEALVAPGAHRRATRAAGDDTVATTVYDRVRGYRWPDGYTSRVLRTPFVARWHGRDQELTGALDRLAVQYRRAVEEEDFDVAQIAVGETIGIVRDIGSAAEVVADIVREASAALQAHRPDPA